MKERPNVTVNDKQADTEFTAGVKVKIGGIVVTQFQNTIHSNTAELLNTS